MKYLKCILVFAMVSSYWSVLNAQILHDNSCSSISTNFTLDWEDSPGANQFNWTPQGATSFSASNIQGSGYQIDFSLSGATGTLASENGISTPGVTNSLSGGADALHISSSGLSGTGEIRLEMEFTPALAGNISFDIYNVIEQFIAGDDPGQQIEIYGLTSTGFAIVPQLTDNGSPSWELEGPGVIDGIAASTAGTNDQVGVNFKSISDIETITIILRRCSSCDNVANTEFAIGDIDVCLTPDTDQDGIADTQDDDDDNDGIYDVIEKCPASAPVTADWDNYPYANGDPSNTYALPDGTNMTVAVSSNGASIVAGETNSDLTGGQGGGTVGLFLNGNQNLQVNSIDVSFSWDQAISDLSYTIFDVDQLGGQYVDSITIIGFYDGFVVFPTMTPSANNTVTQNRAVGDVSTADNLATANLDVAFSEPIDSMVIYYGNGSTAPPAPGNQWITIWDFTYIGDCGSVDSDGDGVPDYLDIDADNDGIVDYIEWQASSASPIAPAGADADSDGIDDNFEVVGAPVDTDGDGIPDFKDPDSDNDGDLDLLEGWDTDNDDVANTTPSGTDADGDGLDDAFDNQAGFNSTTNITNNGQDSEDFPDLDGGTGEQDWREDTDIDDDGIQDYDDIDDDNDGILDVDEGKLSNNPSGDEDGDGIQNWSDATDDGNGGDGSITDYADSNADGIPDVYDADNDGIPNHHDPDSDGDGIADIVEAGGADSNGDGIADDETDTDNDGWPDLFDSDNGGTALTDVDEDGDGLQNHLDIDADDDGIVDIIESQPTGALTSPSGTDSDNDGIDDNFDTDEGNSLTDPENTDSADNPDYLDTNTDNDIETDLVEGWDTNNDGTANTTPAGSDSDNDGLDDNFDDVSGQNSTTNVTNGGQTASSFPDLDTPGGELDWRDVNNTNDNDGDGIANADDIDDDNDGVLDINELDCPSAATITSLSTDLAIQVGTLPLLLNGSTGDQDFYWFDNQAYPGDTTEIFGITLSQAAVVTEIRILLEADVNPPDGSFLGTGMQYVVQGLNGSVWENVSADSTADGTFSVPDNGEVIEVNANTRAYTQYRIAWIGGGQLEWDPYIDEVEVEVCNELDSDNDGVNDSDDPDSDGDGIADIVEAGGVDTDGNGVVDGSFTDSNSDGWEDSFDNDLGGTALTDADTDGDGLENRIDLDSDDDGIIDIVESQPSGILISPSGTDSDGDGIDDSFDTNEGNTLTDPENTDGTDNPDFTDTDSDNDGDLDALEGYDTDNDGTAETSPAGSDSDNDGLDDNYDNEVGPNATTNVTNGGQSSASFTDLDRPTTPELDWREDKDYDGDGLTDDIDIDDDNDGILDVDECNGGGSVGVVANTVASGTGSYTVPVNGQVTISMNGGDGGGGSNNPGGSGATIDAIYEVTAGQVLRYVVGEGSDGVGTSSAGGGGSSGLFIDNDLVMVAGGGGGGDNSGGAVGFGANSTTSGDDGNGGSPGSGGVAGSGGTVGGSDAGAGGGINSAGGSSDAGGGSAADLVPGNGVTLVAGGAGFGAGTDGGDGFTGGGGGDDGAWSGGGGGYSGGGASGSGGSAGGGGSFLDNGIGSFVSGSITAGVDGGGGATGANGDDGFVIISFNGTCSVDTDNDGVINSLDPDSDNDGLADIIEAGGVDTDGDGIADDVTDTDGDGWPDIFDSDDGGTALTDVDTDGDGLENRIDIDADDDGIVDVIESQATGSQISPSGTDTDGDGIDDNFDTDEGNSLTTAVDTENDGTPDYLDINSDDDLQDDIIEAWDIDNDGVADTSPAGTDSDGDGLDDNFDNEVGPNASTNPTNGGQSAVSFPNLDDGNTNERDWREIIDTDGDGIADEIDADDDNDGIPDAFECGSEISEGGFDGITGLGFGNNLNEDISPWVNNGPTNVILVDGITPYDPGGPDYDARGGAGNYYDINGSGDIYQTFTISSTAEVFYDGYFSARDGGTGNGEIEIRAGTGTAGAIQSTTGTLTTSDNTAWTYTSNSVTLSPGTYSLVVVMDNFLNVDELSVNLSCDTDGDGVENRLDLDADNDGIADIIEAGGTDADNDGRADNITDTDGDGFANTFDSDNGGSSLPVADSDGDGIENYLDIDSDSDGILDNVEGQTTAGFRAPQNADTDGDGWDDEYDSDNGGTAITLSDNDGAGDPDYLAFDSDGDGLPDWIEGFDDNNSEDALDDLIDRADAFETNNGNPGLYVNADDTDADGIPNWLEDDNANSIPNVADASSPFFVDTDQDGIIDLYDPDNGGVSSSTPDGDGDGEYDFRDTDNQVSLPIELLEFTANKQDDNVKLTWITAVEINNDYYIVEHSADGEKFSRIAKIKGAGNSTQTLYYTTLHENPIVGINYYRLKQVDFDGNHSYSDNRIVNFSRRTAFKLYPNPTSGKQLFISIEKPKAGRYRLSILSNKGKLVVEREFSIEAETLYYEAEILKEVKLASGLYLILLESNGEQETMQFIVR
ncbi:MAG: T9SS type A sorting domain-containing protein [Vicingaceae bacterium]